MTRSGIIELARGRGRALALVGRTGAGAAPLVVLATLGAALPHPLAAQDGLLDRPAGFVVEDVPLARGISELERGSGVRVAFSVDLIPSDHRVSCRCRTVTVRVALESMLAGTNLGFREGLSQILIAPRRARVSGVVGVVTDATTGSPVSDVVVAVVGTDVRTLTDRSGRFVLAGAPEGAARLSIDAFGYQSAEHTVAIGNDDGAPLRLPIERAPIPLAEMIITPGSFGILDQASPEMGVAITREDIEAIPQFGDDAFRTLKRMPGVTSDDISTRLNVRGEPGGNLLVRLDGIELYDPYHLKDLDAATGIVDVQSLGQIDLLTGGFGADHGDKLAGVFDMRTRQAPPTGARTTVGMSLSTLSANSQGSFANGRGQWLGSVRRGFLDIVLKIGGTEDDMSPSFWDVLAKVQYLVTDNHLVAVEALVAGDDMNWREDDQQARIRSLWRNSYAWLRWGATFRPWLRAETVASAARLTTDRTGFGGRARDGVFAPLRVDIRDDRTFDLFGVRQDWEVDLGDDAVLKIGFDAKTTDAGYDYFGVSEFWDVTPTGTITTRVDTVALVTDPTGTESSAYLTLRRRFGPRFTWEAGARVDHHSHTDETHVSPRVIARLDLSDVTRLRGSWGRYAQAHGIQELHSSDGQSEFSPAEEAQQVAMGIERDFGNGWSGRAEAYYRSIDDPRPVFVNLARGVDPIPEVQSDRALVDPTEGRARGLEFLLRRDAATVNGSASYILASAEDRVDGRWAPRTLDQRHTLNLFLAYRPNPRWQFSASWQYHSGWPATNQMLDLELVSEQDGGEPTINLLRREFGPYNADQLPGYHRLDVRATRAFQLGRSRLELYLDVFNAYNQTNLRGFSYNLRGTGNGRFTTDRDNGEELLPILPTLGFRLTF